MVVLDWLSITSIRIMACFVNTGCSLKIAHAFVTGATGFIGTRLTKKLIDNGVKVTCLVRPQSNIEPLKRLGCQLVYGDLRDESLSLPGIEQCDTLFHAAAMKNAANPKEMLSINPRATRNLFEAVLVAPSRPKVIHISSLAACGPSAKNQPAVEKDTPAPVSFYGRSKLETERVAISYADRTPVSIVRPPIVMGQGDSNTLRMFKLIQKYNCHLIPGLTDRQYSLIHVDDLVNALICVAEQGQPIAIPEANAPAGTGIYFASTEQLSYAQLGQKIAVATGRTKTRCLYIARPIFWSVGAVNSLLARVTNRARFLNLDKYREAAAGEWTCSPAKLLAETDFESPEPFENRLKETVQWYQESGWLDQRAQPPFHVGKA